MCGISASRANIITALAVCPRKISTNQFSSLTLRISRHSALLKNRQPKTKPILTLGKSSQARTSCLTTPTALRDTRAKVRSTRFMSTGYQRRAFSGSRDAREQDKKTSRAFIALGSNMGDRFGMIEQACKLMDEHEGIHVLRTSGLWETKAMYVEDQADFLNGACEIETTLPPLELLEALQDIENKLHRKKIINKGPRNIDLDILLYDDIQYTHERLIIPHKLIKERAFVLQPLCELIPDETIPGLEKSLPIRDLLKSLPTSTRPNSPLTPLSPSLPPIASLDPRRKTHVMSILNLTPDSFSDGGLNSSTDIPTTTKTLLSHLSAGATIIDIGGQSTRPGAEIVTAEEETTRVVPLVKHLSPLLSSTASPLKAAISIDTFRASVARAAISAGAHIINDVSAGTLDPAMLPTVASLGCTVTLMHMRGTPSTMSKPPHTLYPSGLIPTIGAELLSRVRAAEAAGIRRWRIILDPGIGFAKTGSQNLEILRRFEELRAYPGLEGLPWLVGTSRKGFIGKITGVESARERVWGTAAAVVAAVQGGAGVVRVHDVGEMVQVVKMADAIWRVPGVVQADEAGEDGRKGNLPKQSRVGIS